MRITSFGRLLYGWQPIPGPACLRSSWEIANDIPIGKGLGSSAAALTAGVVIANQVLGLGWDAHRVLDEAAQIEGHPDNVAACVLGSIVASAIDSEGVGPGGSSGTGPALQRRRRGSGFVLPTSEARRVLPTTYSRGRHGVQCPAQRVADRRAGLPGRVTFFLQLSKTGASAVSI